MNAAPPPSAVLADSMASPPAGACPQKRAQIVDGAAKVFAADGYEGASMSRIAAEAGVSKGTLYNYFAGKAELFTAYVQRDCSRNIALVFEDLDLARPPEETLRRIGHRVLAMLLKEPSLVLYRMVVAEAEKFPELAMAFYAEGPAHAIAHVSRYLARMTQEGRLAVEHPDFAADQFIALIQTQLCMKRRLRLIGMPPDVQIDRVVECAVHLFMRGFGAKPLD